MKKRFTTDAPEIAPIVYKNYRGGLNILLDASVFCSALSLGLGLAGDQLGNYACAAMSIFLLAHSIPVYVNVRGYEKGKGRKEEG